MPDAADTTAETLAAPAAEDAAAPDDPGAPNLWLAALFALVVALVAIQNLWLRRRAERENASTAAKRPDA